jgi:hypothetical protein
MLVVPTSITIIALMSLDFSIDDQYNQIENGKQIDHTQPTYAHNGAPEGKGDGQR